MICVAVLEPNAKRLQELRNLLCLFTMQRNCELDLLIFTDKNPIAKLEKYEKKIQIALISLDNEYGEEIGKYLYERNQDCRICYYREKPCEIENLLPTRPIAFYLWNTARVESFQKYHEIYKVHTEFFQKFNEIYEEVLFTNTTFRYETKSRLYVIAKQNILYFRSDLRYVDVFVVHGENSRILVKLTELEPLAGDGFVRVHKSYLVNSKYVLWVDKKKHSVVLSNGEQIPVSDAQYEHVCEKLRCIK